MRVLHCIVKQFLTTKAARGLDYQPLFRKGTSLEPRERVKSSMGSMLMIALYLILTIQKKKYIQTTTKTNKQTKTSIVFLHLLKGVVFQLITLFLATPLTLLIRCKESRSGHSKQSTLAVLLNWAYFLTQYFKMKLEFFWLLGMLRMTDCTIQTVFSLRGKQIFN